MLKGINPLLTGSLLKILDEMGHSDTVVIADANFPAHRVNSCVVEVPGVDVVAMTEAIATIITLDDEHPPVLMESGQTPRPVVQDEILTATGAPTCTMIDRWKYYDIAVQAQAIISTGELRLWANVILSKGLPYSQHS